MDAVPQDHRKVRLGERGRGEGFTEAETEEQRRREAAPVSVLAACVSMEGKKELFLKPNFSFLSKLRPLKK